MTVIVKMLPEIQTKVADLKLEDLIVKENTFSTNSGVLSLRLYAI